MQKRILICLLLVIVFLSGCKEGDSYSFDETDSISYGQYLTVLKDITITVKTDPVTTQTKIIELEFTNRTDKELSYCEESIILEKKVGDDFISAGQYGTGHTISTLLSVNGTNLRSISIEPLEVGTYRFVFLQGYSTPDGPVYISSEFQVTE